jgi:hypothetical protein
MLAHVLLAMVSISTAAPGPRDEFCKGTTAKVWERYQNFRRQKVEVLKPLVNAVHAKLSSITPEQRKAIASGRRKEVDLALHESTRENPYLGEPDETCASPYAKMFRSDGSDAEMPYRMNRCRELIGKAVTGTIKKNATFLTISKEGLLRLSHYEFNSKHYDIRIPILPTLKEEEELLKEQATDLLPNWKEFFKVQANGCPFVEYPGNAEEAEDAPSRPETISPKAAKAVKEGACKIAERLAWDELQAKRAKWDGEHPGVAEALGKMLDLVSDEIRSLEDRKAQIAALAALNNSPEVKGMNHEGYMESRGRRDALLTRFIPNALTFQVSYFDEIPGSLSGGDESIYFKLGSTAEKDREYLENLLDLKAAGKTWTRIYNEEVGAECKKAPSSLQPAAQADRRAAKTTPKVDDAPTSEKAPLAAKKAE